MEKIKGNCPKAPNSSSLLLTAVLLVFALSGCGYTLQTKANLPFDAITIGSIENRTLEPKLQDRLNRALAETFMEYGFRIVPNARYRLDCDITNFSMKTLSEKELTAVEYEVSIRAVFRLLDAEKDSVKQIVVDNPFVTSLSAVGTLQTIMSGKELASERALKDIAGEVARRIIYEP